jgi:hypothetical protein
MRTLWSLTGLTWMLLASSASSAQNVLPPKNVIALTPENFCLGLKNAFAITKQNFAEEAAFLCPAQVPSPLFRTLLSNAYQGVGEPVITNILIQETPSTKTSQVTVAYAMKINKPPFKVLLAEEKRVTTPYAENPLTISAKFGTPPLNTGDADTAFTVEQRAKVEALVSFDDISMHDLKLYRLYPNNFEFFMAARTLQTPSEQFKKSVVFRGVMRDPMNANASYSFSVLNFVMNSRDQHARVVDAFSKFIIADFKVQYTDQNK